MSEKFTYAGRELDFFSQAVNWKRYFYRFLNPYVHGDVLEVGAGIGGTTPYLHHHSRNWTCLEPDAELARQCEQNLRDLRPPVSVKVQTIEQLDEKDLFDCILYADVLEHILDDKKEMQMAAKHLKPQGKLLVLSPAHPALFSPFDTEIGHFRRYHRASLRALTPPDLELRHLFYVDSAGMIASLGNKIFLRQGLPTDKQIHFWDRVLIRISKFLDPVFNYNIGKSIIGVWEKSAAK